MTETEKQAALVRSLVGECRVEIREDGFMSRAFVIDGGRLVVKFPRNESVRYDEEIRNLDFINTLDLGVNVQKTAFAGPAGSWLGVYGVPGRPLARTCLTDEQKVSVGRQLGAALKLLHSADWPGRSRLIDFNESCRMDEAADFMDIGDDAVCGEMMTSCGADDVLRQKTRLRRIARPLIVLQPYLCRGDRRELDRQMRILRQTEWT